MEIIRKWFKKRATTTTEVHLFRKEKNIKCTFTKSQDSRNFLYSAKFRRCSSAAFSFS